MICEVRVTGREFVTFRGHAPPSLGFSVSTGRFRPRVLRQVAEADGVQHAIDVSLGSLHAGQSSLGN